MKIKRFNENRDSDVRKFYVYETHFSNDTYRGSIWDTHRPRWIPKSSKLVTEFEIENPNNKYFILSQEELDELNNYLEKNEIEKNTKKYNL